MFSVSVLSYREESRNLQLSAQKSRRDEVDLGCVQISNRVIEEVELIQAVCRLSIELSRERTETEY